MKYCVKQRIFTWGDRFDIYNEYGEQVFYVEGEIFTLGKKLHIFDRGGNEIMYIEQRLFTFLPSYDIYINGRHQMTVNKEFTLFHQSYTVDGFDLKVEGDFLSHEYSVISPSENIAVISKEWFTWGDCYTVDCISEKYSLPSLAILLTIDCVAANAKS